MGWSISEYHTEIPFHPVLVPFDIGVVYIMIGSLGDVIFVLVPFDIGVVYIQRRPCNKILFGFSPLRYWGGLYHIGEISNFIELF